MAEIRVEKKKPVWPWVILILLLAGIVVYIFVYDNYNDNIDDIIDAEESRSIEPAK